MMLVVFCGNINKWGKKPHFSRSNGFFRVLCIIYHLEEKRVLYRKFSQ